MSEQNWNQWQKAFQAAMEKSGLPRQQPPKEQPPKEQLNRLNLESISLMLIKAVADAVPRGGNERDVTIVVSPQIMNIWQTWLEQAPRTKNDAAPQGERIKVIYGARVLVSSDLQETEFLTTTQKIHDVYDELIYRCPCGHIFDPELGKYGCPNCEGEHEARLGRK